MTTTEKTAVELSLHRKLLLVAAKLTSVSKSHRNVTQRYQYAAAEDFITEVRPHLHEAGILILPKIEADWQAVKKLKDGNEVVVNMAHLNAEYTITDGNESLVIAIPGEGIDHGDKATYKALTGSYKYMLRELFMLAMTDDPEKDESIDKAVETPRHTSPAKKHTITQSLGDKLPLPRCKNCDELTKYVPAGVSKKSGKEYSAFYACEDRNCQGGSWFVDEWAEEWMKQNTGEQDKPATDEPPPLGDDDLPF